MARPIVALLTDFGSRDHYAGVMKGVILSVAPDITLIDVLHDLPAHDIPFAARELEATYKYFPAGTIFLVVVDPGVGTTRRGLAAEVGEWKFVAPDNGVLTGVFRESPPRRVVELSERRYARPTVSRTFEGRDRFAPAAGWLARGIPLASLGKNIANYQVIDLPKAEAGTGAISGEIVRVDRFGNLISNIDHRSFAQLADAGTVAVAVGGRDIPRLVATYADAPAGELCALFGSTDHLEIAVNGGDAARALSLGRGAKVTVRLV